MLRRIARLAVFVTFFLALGMCAVACADGHRASDHRPNILLIFVDDVGYGDIGANGCRDLVTPNIDSIANEGVRFTSGYVAAPGCGPSRAALMTGRYMGRFGYEDNRCITGGVSTAETFISRTLQSAGYATGHIGKWHLGTAEGQHPTDRGFDETYKFSGKDLRPRPDWYAQQAVAFIEKHRCRPFFLYLAPVEAHTKLAATQDRLDRVAHIEDKWRRLYAAMVLGIDDMVGTVLKKLREEQLDKHTLVFFISDNGGSLRNTVFIYDGTTVDQPWVYQDGSPRLIPGCRSNAPLSGGKGSLAEGGIRIPFFMRWYGTIPAGKVCENPVISMDVFATAAALAKARVPAGRRIDGVNLIPFLSATGVDGVPHEYLYWKKQVGDSWWTVARKGNWKLSDRAGRVELYDLGNDVGEERNVASQHPELVKEMRLRLSDWVREVTAECDASGFKYLSRDEWAQQKRGNAAQRED